MNSYTVYVFLQNTLTTESEDDTISRSTAVANINVTVPTRGSDESFIDSRTAEYKHVTKAGYVFSIFAIVSALQPGWVI